MEESIIEAQPSGIQLNVSQTQTFSKLSDVDYKCCICYEDRPQSKFSRLECNHQFHCQCVEGWLKNKSSCPYCRRSCDYYIQIQSGQVVAVQVQRKEEFEQWNFSSNFYQDFYPSQFQFQPVQTLFPFISIFPIYPNNILDSRSFERERLRNRIRYFYFENDGRSENEEEDSIYYLSPELMRIERKVFWLSILRNQDTQNIKRMRRPFDFFQLFEREQYLNRFQQRKKVLEKLQAQQNIRKQKTVSGKKVNRKIRKNSQIFLQKNNRKIFKGRRNRFRALNENEIILAFSISSNGSSSFKAYKNT